MEMRTGRARYPARVTPQMSAELKARLLEVAEREHGRGLQALRRQCLQARVEGNHRGRTNWLRSYRLRSYRLLTDFAKRPPSGTRSHGSDWTRCWTGLDR